MSGPGMPMEALLAKFQETPSSGKHHAILDAYHRDILSDFRPDLPTLEDEQKRTTDSNARLNARFTGVRSGQPMVRHPEMFLEDLDKEFEHGGDGMNAELFKIADRTWRTADTTRVGMTDSDDRSITSGGRNPYTLAKDQMELRRRVKDKTKVFSRQMVSGQYGGGAGTTESAHTRSYVNMIDGTQPGMVSLGDALYDMSVAQYRTPEISNRRNRMRWESVSDHVFDVDEYGRVPVHLRNRRSRPMGELLEQDQDRGDSDQYRTVGLLMKMGSLVDKARMDADTDESLGTMITGVIKHGAVSYLSKTATDANPNDTWQQSAGSRTDFSNKDIVAAMLRLDEDRDKTTSLHSQMIRNGVLRSEGKCVEKMTDDADRAYSIVGQIKSGLTPAEKRSMLPKHALDADRTDVGHGRSNRRTRTDQEGNKINRAIGTDADATDGMTVAQYSFRKPRDPKSRMNATSAEPYGRTSGQNRLARAAKNNYRGKNRDDYDTSHTKFGDNDYMNRYTGRIGTKYNVRDMDRDGDMGDIADMS